MKRPLLGITLAFCLGILSQDLFNIPIFYLFLAALMFLVLSLLLIKSKKIFLATAALGFLFLGSLTYEYHQILPKDYIKNIIGANQIFPRHIFIQGRILNNPETKIDSFGRNRRKFLLEIETVKVDTAWQTARGILLTNVFNPQFDFKYGDGIILEGDLSLPRPATNPGQFDYKRFLERKKIFYILNVKQRYFSKVLGPGRVNIVKLVAYKTSAGIEALIDKFIPLKEGAILKALILGKREDISNDINDDFVNTGTVHILSISGLHVGLLAAIFILLFKILRLPFKFWAFALGFLMIFYCVMVDAAPPITRATIMILVFLFARVLKKEQDLLNSLALSAFLILLFNPQDFFDIGFQLSFLTMGSLIYLVPLIEGIFKIDTRLKAYILGSLIASFSAWLGSAPIIAKYFNIVSPVTFLANLFAVPWVFLVLASAVAFILFGCACPVLGLIFSQAVAFNVDVLLASVNIFSKLPFAYFRIEAPSWISIAVFYLFVLLFFNRGRIKLRAKYFLIAGMFILNIYTWHNVFFDKKDFLRVTFLDVGKGDAIFLEFPKGGTMLIDGGEGFGFDAGRAVVSGFLASKGINKIDLVAATHPHTDHIGGLVTVLKNFKVRVFMDNGDVDANPLYEQCLDLVRQKRITRFIVKEGGRIEGFEGVKILVLNPPAKKFSDLNDDSIVLKLKSEDYFSILLSGDIGEDAAKSLLLSESKELPSTIFKVPHHGGALGDIAPEFIKTINPEAAIISLGDREVNDNLLSTLNRLQTRIYRTDTDGAIILKNEKDKKDKYSILKFRK